MTAETVTPPVKSRPRIWILYFVLLILLGCVAMLAPVLYNWSLQLKPDQLAAARKLWTERGFSDYDLDYRIQRDRDRRPDVYHVEVRNGLAVRVICNGQLLLVNDAPTGLALGNFAGCFHGDDPARQTVEGILAHLDTLIRRTEGRAAPARDYLVARFHPELGHPIHFIYRVAGTHQRQEWTIRLTQHS